MAMYGRADDPGASRRERNNRPMSDDELASFLQRKIRQAMNDEDGDVAQLRIENYNYYMGKPYGNERDGHSQVVTRDVLETIEWAKPAIVSAFTAGDPPVMFEAEGPEDEGEAEQQSEIVRKLMSRNGQWFRSIYGWVTDCLMFPNGYVKAWVEESTKTSTNEYTGLSEMAAMQALQSLSERGEVEVLEQSVTPAGMQELGDSIDMRVRLTETRQEVRVESVPPDEVLVDNDLYSLELEKADFVAHRRRRSYTDLVSEGVDPAILDNIGEGEDYQWEDERTNRLFMEDEDPDAQDDDDDSMRMYWVHECWVLVDYDGDGLAERRRVVMIEKEIIENDEDDYLPLVAMASIPVPHRHLGLSVADLVKELQLLKSEMWRQLMDNVYRLNVRRKYVGRQFVDDQADTIDTLLDPESEIIPARDPGAINEEQVQPIVGDIFPVIQGLDDLSAVRTGITPKLSLDPQVLQQSTFGAFGAALEQASQRVQMIIRTMAETGVSELWRKIHRLLRTHVQRRMAVKMRGQWIEFDPSTWDERTDVEARVGLGFHRKEQRLMLFQGLLQMQKEGLQIGLTDPVKILASLDEMMELSGIGPTSKFWASEQEMQARMSQPPPEQPPDPRIMIAMRQLEAESEKSRAELDLKMAQEQSNRAKLQLEAEKVRAELARTQAQMEAERARTMQMRAQAIETLQKARQLDLQNDAEESGLAEVAEGLEGLVAEATQAMNQE